MMEATNDRPKKRKTARRGNGEGSIYQQADGRWCGRVTVGRSQTGKRKVKAVYAWTKGEVQEKLTKIMAQKQDGLLCLPGRRTLGEFLTQWLGSLSKPRQSTVASYRQIIETHILPTLGGSQLATLEPSNIDAFYLTLRDSGASDRLVQMVHTVLHRALGRAVKQGIVARNVCTAVERPASEHKEMKCLDMEQANTFLAAVDFDRLHAMYVMAVYCGLRQGELYGLRRDDFDLDSDKGSVAIRRTLVELKGKFSVNPPKSKAGTRRIKFGPTVAKAIHAHLERMRVEGNAESPYVFCDRKGGPLRRQNVLRRSFRPALERAELPMIRFHDLRHTCATIALLSGVHVKIVSSMLGHSKISITLDLYSHVLDSMTDDAADRMESAIATAKANPVTIKCA